MDVCDVDGRESHSTDACGTTLARNRARETTTNFITEAKEHICFTKLIYYCSGREQKRILKVKTKPLEEYEEDEEGNWKL